MAPEKPGKLGIFFSCSVATMLMLKIIRKMHRCTTFMYLDAREQYTGHQASERGKTRQESR